MTGPRAEIARRFLEKDDFLVASHANPDGDAVGSTASVGYILKALGKRFTLYNPSGVPRQYDWMEFPGELCRELPEKGFAWCVCLDCGGVSRLGPKLEQTLDRDRILNIDHHLGNPLFGAVNWVDTAYSSTGEMVADLARDLGVPLAGPLAEAVYVAVVTDTGYFSYGGTRPETLELAAELMRNGLDLAGLNARVQNQWSLSRIRLWSDVMGGVRLHCDGRIGSARITRKQLESAGAMVEDCDGLINNVLKIRGVAIAATVRETAPGEVKFSLRSVGDVNVQKLAARFGGGGHKNAAGGTIVADPERAEAVLLEAAAETLDCAGAHG